MADIEINANGVSIPDTQTIYDYIYNEWNTIFGGNMQPDPTTPQGQMITSLVAEIENKNKLINYFINQINPKTNEGIWQDAIANIFFLSRKGAESSIVSCICYGASGTIIPAGSLIKSTNGDLFEAVGSITINITGQGTGTFRSVENGLIPVVENTINEIVSVVSGWDSVNNPTAGTLGRLIETRLDFEKRREQSQAKNGKNTIASLYARLGEVDDVLSVYARSNRTNTAVVVDGITIPAFSIYICVLGGTTQEVAETIEKVIGATDQTIGNTSYQVLIPENNVLDTINFERPTPFDIEINITLKSTPTTPFGIEETIKNIVYNDFYNVDGNSIRVGIGEILYASRFYTGISSIEGISIISIQINKTGQTPNNYVYIPINKYGVLDKNNINVVIQD